MLVVTDRTMGKLYAIRGGHGHGVYEKFYEAIDAGWYQKQPYGNAAAFSLEEREEAHAWIDGRTPFPEGQLNAMKSKVKEQHIFVRIMLLSIFTTLMSSIIVKAAYLLHDNMDCKHFPASGSVPCIWSLKLITLANERQNEVFKFIGTQLIALVGVSFTHACSYF